MWAAKRKSCSLPRLVPAVGRQEEMPLPLIRECTYIGVVRVGLALFEVVHLLPSVELPLGELLATTIKYMYSHCCFHPRFYGMA
jgi:hypothetical protein